jgi:hypothetical protein
LLQLLMLGLLALACERVLTIEPAGLHIRCCCGGRMASLRRLMHTTKRRPRELDCGYGENVVVHAVGQNGENYLVSVLKMEAASEIRRDTWNYTNG